MVLSLYQRLCHYEHYEGKRYSMNMNYLVSALSHASKANDKSWMGDRLKCSSVSQSIKMIYVMLYYVAS